MSKLYDRMIIKYGKIEGEKRYAIWKSKQGHNLNFYINRYGIAEGTKKYNESSRNHSEGLKKSHREHPEIWKNAGKKISKTKLSKEGNERLHNALIKCKDRLHRFKKGDKPANYIPEELKPRIICLNCGKIHIVTPTIAKTKKYCNNICRLEYITGRPMENWNPNSFHNTTGYGVCGEYKNIRFRSTLELAFIIFALKNNLNIQAEPFAIPIKDYLNQIQQEEFGDLFNKNTKYTPDYLINNKQLIEIKPEDFVYNGTDNYDETKKLTMKLIVGNNYCRKHNLEFLLLTSDAMKDFILTDKKIKQIPKEDILFFKLKHKNKYDNYREFERNSLAPAMFQNEP